MKKHTVPPLMHDYLEAIHKPLSTTITALINERITDYSDCVLTVGSALICGHLGINTLSFFFLFSFFHYSNSHTSSLSSIIISISAAEIAYALPPMQSNEAPISSSLTMIEPLNSQARQAFYHMLDSRRDHSRKRVTTSQRLKYIKWLTAPVPERIDTMEGKKRAWIRFDFEYQHGKL